jgi:hypothetical protein
MGSFGQTSLKQKISCKCTFKSNLPPERGHKRFIIYALKQKLNLLQRSTGPGDGAELMI